jgi:flagellar hook-associated protein 1 FlgK
MEVSIRVKADGTDLNISSGAIGGLLRQRAETIEPAVAQIDTFASELIYQVNRIHSQGQGTSGWSSVTSQYAVDDPTIALGALGSGVPFPIENGSFFITVTNTATGADSSHMIQVDPASMSLDALRSEITSAMFGTGVTASVGDDGKLTIDAPAGSELGFSEDSSGALAALGINSFFQGTSAVDISVSESLSGHPTKLATGGGFIEGSNATALAMVELREMGLEALSGRSLREYWQAGVNDLAVRTDAANTRLQGASLVRDSLDAQNASISGVSLDEEAIDLLSYQRQFQAAARYLSIIDETLKSLLSIV